MGMETKNFEVTHTLRLYDSALISKLGELMEKEKKHYRNKNEFLTEVVRLGYVKYLEREQDQMRAKMERETGDAAEPVGGSGCKETYASLLKLSEFITVQFKNLYVNQKIMHKLLSAVYNIIIKSTENDWLEGKAEEGFFDDLPARFENIIINLKARYGLN